MNIFDFPDDILPDSVTWKIVTNTQIFSSPLSQSVQTVELPGARWVASFTYTNLQPEEARRLIAFLVKLRGPSNRVRIYDLGHPTPAGSSPGVPVVAGVGQKGSTLVTSGWAASQDDILKAGDYIGVNDELKMVVEDASSDAAGLSTLVIEPPLRREAIDGQLVTTTKSTARMILMDDEQVEWSYREAAILSDISIDFVEAFI